MAATTSSLTRIDLAQLVDGMNLPILVFVGRRITYLNEAARDLEARLRDSHRTELVILLLNHLEALGPILTETDTTTLLTPPTGETFVVELRSLGAGGRPRVAVSIRELGTGLDAVCRCYRLTAREIGVVQLLLRGYNNRDIASTLGVTQATVKRHLNRVFDKMGVDSRTQLVCRLA